MSMVAEVVDAVVGGDTHKHTHTLKMLSPPGGQARERADRQQRGGIRDRAGLDRRARSRRAGDRRPGGHPLLRHRPGPRPARGRVDGDEFEREQDHIPVIISLRARLDGVRHSRSRRVRQSQNELAINIVDGRVAGMLAVTEGSTPVGVSTNPACLASEAGPIDGVGAARILDTAPELSPCSGRGHESGGGFAEGPPPLTRLVPVVA